MDIKWIQTLPTRVQAHRRAQASNPSSHAEVGTVWLAGLPATMEPITDVEALAVHLPSWQPMRQSGPTCGLVAAAMAIRFITHGRHSVSVERLLAIGQQRGWTRQGEWFDAGHLHQLLQDHLATANFHPGRTVQTPVYSNVPRCRFSVRHVLNWERPEQLVEYLSNGTTVCLVPYDKDGNHEPCLRRGHRAHWALLVGLVTWAGADRTACGNLSDTTTPHSVPAGGSGGELVPLRIQSLAQWSQAGSPQGVALVAFHGGSLHAAIWDMKQLWASNRQLMQVDPGVRDAHGSYVIPADGGLTKSLCGQLLLIHCAPVEDETCPSVDG